MSDDITDPVAGVAYCNKHIKKLEQMVEEAQAKGDYVSAMKGEGHLVAWTEQLQHYIRMKFQQGMETEDISKSAKKKRYTA